MVKKIKFVINKDGEVELNVEGATGSSCKSLTEPFEALLGEVSNRTLKDTYYNEVENERTENIDTNLH